MGKPIPRASKNTARPPRPARRTESLEGVHPSPLPSGERPSRPLSGLLTIPLPDSARSPLGAPAAFAHSLARAASGPANPPTARFELPVHLKGTPAQWLSRLSSAGFSSARLHGPRLVLERVQSVDLSGQPHQVIRLHLSPRRVEVSYSTAPSESPALRRLEAVRLLLAALEAAGALEPPAALSGLLSSVLADAEALAGAGSAHTLHRLEELTRTNAEMAERLRRLEAQREADARQSVEDARSREGLRERLALLESVSDATLEEALMEWLRTHDGRIRLVAFSQEHQLPPARVEAALDRLCKAGRLERVHP